MMRIRVYCISKPQNDAYDEIAQHFMKLARAFGVNFEIIEVFNKSIMLAQKSSKKQESALAYCDALKSYLVNGYNVALTPQGDMVETKEFAKIMAKQDQPIHFFIGGAYGFNEEFLQQCSRNLSLSPLTMGHKIAKTVLCEQIYRALTIIRNHPYHK